MKVAVAIPCFKVKKHILQVINSIGEEVDVIIAVDDCCPENTGEYILEACNDPRLIVIKHEKNLGVGGAIKTAYKKSLELNVDIVVKVDGDGQMNPKLIPRFIQPIVNGTCDYTKGSRFFNLESLLAMPALRKLGNTALSFVNKVSSGYWNIMDPTNGFTAIHKNALSLLPLDKINDRYFFESDMLFRLGTIRAVVRDVPMDSVYDDEESNLSVRKVLVDFPPLYIKSFYKRVFYTYFLRDLNGASMQMILGLTLILFGSIWGTTQWISSAESQIITTSGTVMIGALPIILGCQFMLSAINYDMNNMPSSPLVDKW
ncbi:glycosyltransferase family 2 protein [Vibrio rumoiensis]|uniref:Glycosyltransferase family 2 protein n=1 Tax=Vibrio rumoiensis TaxID=76258 RepID=A0ABW7IRI6_9VIBR